MLRITVASLLHMHKRTKMCMLSLMPETGRWATNTFGQLLSFATDRYRAVKLTY